MRKIILGTTAAAALAVAGVAAPASARVVSSAGAGNLHGPQSNVIDVRWHGRWHGGWHHGWRGGFRGPYRHYGWRYRHYGWGWGPVIGGLAAGAIVGGALAAQANANSVAWCEAHYRSYDPASQTYLGYDGLRHHCP